jgi:hypothetical protein
LLVPSLAFAQGHRRRVSDRSSSGLDTEEDEAVPDGTVVETRREDKFPLGVHGAVGASIANRQSRVARSSLATELTLADRRRRRYNPVLRGTARSCASGVTNVYATVILRFPMSFENVNLEAR